jgi:hypothetical protein
MLKVLNLSKILVSNETFKNKKSILNLSGYIMDIFKKVLFQNLI